MLNWFYNVWPNGVIPIASVGCSFLFSGVLPMA